jgi:hypothetical protein
MEYLLIFLLYGLGAYFSALEKVAVIRKRNPAFTFKEVGNTYLLEEWNTMMVSFGGLILIEIIWYIVHKGNMQLPKWLHEYGGNYGLALVLGYCFQRVIYKFLGSTESAIQNKIGKDSENKQS